MQIFIHIDCNTDEEALTHIHEIRNKLMKRMIADSDGIEDISFEGSIPIGDHEIIVTER